MKTCFQWTPKGRIATVINILRNQPQIVVKDIPLASCTTIYLQQDIFTFLPIPISEKPEELHIFSGMILPLNPLTLFRYTQDIV